MFKPYTILTVKHPPINNFARSQKNHWETRDKSFQTAVAEFKMFKNTAISYYKDKKRIMNTANMSDGLNHNIINKIKFQEVLNNYSENVQLGNRFLDGYEEEMIKAFRNVKPENERSVFTAVMNRIAEM